MDISIQMFLWAFAGCIALDVVTLAQYFNVKRNRNLSHFARLRAK